MSKVPVDDAVVAYNCQFTSEIYLLIMRNSLHIPSMKHNLILTLIIRKEWLNVSEVTKIHCEDPTVEDHSIYHDLNKLQIPLKLDGIFSYFSTQALTLEEMQRCDEMKHVFLFPDAETWDPYYEKKYLNEEQLGDSGG